MYKFTGNSYLSGYLGMSLNHRHDLLFLLRLVRCSSKRLDCKNVISFTPKNKGSYLHFANKEFIVDYSKIFTGIIVVHYSLLFNGR